MIWLVGNKGMLGCEIEALLQLRKTLIDRPALRERALKDPHLLELRLDARFARLMRQLPSSAPAAESHGPGP